MAKSEVKFAIDFIAILDELQRTSGACRNCHRKLAVVFVGKGVKCEPDLAGLRASARISNRIFALRAPSPGPWHLKQFSVRMDRISRLKSILEVVPFEVWAAPAHIPAIETKNARRILARAAPAISAVI